MEAIASLASRPLLVASNAGVRSPTTHFLIRARSGHQVLLKNRKVYQIAIFSFEGPSWCPLCSLNGRNKSCKPFKSAERALASSSMFQKLRTFHDICSRYLLLLVSQAKNLMASGVNTHNLICQPKKSRHKFSITFVCLVVGMMLILSLSEAVNKSPSWALTEENLLFLEAWRTVDRAYYDKTFNGKSWFRYREDALRNEPMNTREETYMAIRKMLSTLDDPFTRFLEPEKFKSLRADWHSRRPYRCGVVNWLSNCT